MDNAHHPTDPKAPLSQTVKSPPRIRTPPERKSSLPLNNYPRNLSSSSASVGMAIRRQVISFHMPSALHNVFVFLFRTAIWDRLGEIGRQGQRAHAFTDSIVNGLSARVFLFDDGGTWELQPDAQFHHTEARQSSVIIEIALTHDAEDFRRTAKQYIYHTDGQIKVVIGIHLNEDKESTIAAWKPTFTPLQNGDGVEMDIEQVIQSEPFRDANKNPLDGCPNTPFSISYRDMSDMMARAERRKLLRERQKVPESSRHVVNKRRFSASSEDRIKVK